MSFDPPLVAIGVKKDTRNFANIMKGGVMALSFLGSGQGNLAFTLFGDADVDENSFVSKENRYGYETSSSGAPVLTDVGLRQDKPGIVTVKELGLNYGG